MRKTNKQKGVAMDSTENQNGETKIDEIANKYTEGFERFSNSKSGNVILEFFFSNGT